MATLRANYAVLSTAQGADLCGLRKVVMAQSMESPGTFSLALQQRPCALIRPAQVATETDGVVWELHLSFELLVARELFRCCPGDTWKAHVFIIIVRVC